MIQKNLLSLGLALTTAFAGLAAQAQSLTIHAAESGIGKFHRYDNQVHPYGADNAWTPFILPADADLSQATLVYENANGSFTIFYSSLEELLLKIKEISVARGQKVSQFNINAHGMPGGMWFPKDAAQRESPECASWREAATGSDLDNYSQYYSPISKTDIMQMRALSERPGRYGCTAGVPEWEEIVNRNPEVKEAFADDLQVHMLSCLVGLGSVGDNYTKGLASLLLTSESGRIQSSLQYGLGDWSMPEGMGFWDYQDDAQLSRDNRNYPVNRSDREMAQRGTIRVAMLNSQNQSTSGLIADVDFMLLTKDLREARPTPETRFLVPPNFVVPERLRLPGTRFFLEKI